MPPISMAGMKDMLFKSLHIMSNIKVLAHEKDRWMDNRPANLKNMTDYVHRVFTHMDYQKTKTRKPPSPPPLSHPPHNKKNRKKEVENC